MRQKRWVELLNDYDCDINYHSGKANVIADALSQNESLKLRRVRALQLAIRSDLPEQLKRTQEEALKPENFKTEYLRGLHKRLAINADGMYHYENHLWISVHKELRQLVMDEAHKSKYSIHPGLDKMDQDLRTHYWWPKMKADIAIYVGKCLTCLKVKVKYQKPSGLLQQPNIPVWKWEEISMDFVTHLPRSSAGNDKI
uniref:Putative reverse transcriptase domain-containing protein n=1 Tax=Tanacetum cinerariifolium TaxID=118510 RepID=A0A699LEI2_TANCI|nr:putative reverse transcriptase domain-containing protein [Tanacetum cinerariifolium]